jgi:hypothetical protein
LQWHGPENGQQYEEHVQSTGRHPDGKGGVMKMWKLLVVCVRVSSMFE